MFHMPDEVSQLIQYAYQDNKLGEEFFLGRLRSLGESIGERQFQMKVRKEVSKEVLSQIEDARRGHEHRLQMMPASYSLERNFLSKAVESLEREKRQELVRLSRDLSTFSRELREKLEEYEGMQQLFSALTVTKRTPGEGEPDVRA